VLTKPPPSINLSDYATLSFLERIDPAIKHVTLSPENAAPLEDPTVSYQRHPERPWCAAMPHTICIQARYRFGGKLPAARRGWVLALEPVGRPAGAIGRVLPRRDDTFKAELAGVREHGRAIVLEMLIEQDARRCLGQDEASVALRVTRGSRRRSSPSSSSRSKAHKSTLSSWWQYRSRSKFGMPLSSQATASPSMMIEPVRSRDTVLTMSGTAVLGRCPAGCRASLDGRPCEL
jgi:hypothetical protein